MTRKPNTKKPAAPAAKKATAKPKAKPTTAAKAPTGKPKPKKEAKAGPEKLREKTVRVGLPPGSTNVFKSLKGLKFTPVNTLPLKAVAVEAEKPEKKLDPTPPVKPETNPSGFVAGDMTTCTGLSEGTCGSGKSFGGFVADMIRKDPAYRLIGEPGCVWITAKIDVGLGNSLFVMTNLGLRPWEAPIPMQCADAETWMALIPADCEFEFKLRLNDTTWEGGENRKAAPGEDIAVTPDFGG